MICVWQKGNPQSVRQRLATAGRPSKLPVGYADILADLKTRIRTAQLRTAVAVNRSLIALYWDIGKTIVESQKSQGYGKEVVQRLAADLQKEFPGMAGFSPPNVWRMRGFYLAWAEGRQKLQQPVGEFKSKILAQPVRELPEIKSPAVVAELLAAPPEPMAV